jgi:2'-5' RNA ligase
MTSGADRVARSSRPAAAGRQLAFTALLALAAASASCAARPAPKAAPAAHPGGSLFSTVPCADTPLGREWATLRAEAATRFPDLRLTRVEDLHVTVVYVGPGWKAEDLDRIRAQALVVPRETGAFRPEAVRFGKSGHVVVVELLDGPASWSAAVVAAKAGMNRLGLKKADRYDAEFRPHVTLASAKGPDPDPTEAAALDALRAWLAEKIAAAPARYGVTVGPDTPVRLWLAGTQRPAGAPEYVDVERLLPRR